MFVSMHPRLYTQIIKKNINKSPHSIDIGIIFRKISLENNKTINFSYSFLCGQSLAIKLVIALGYKLT